MNIFNSSGLLDLPESLQRTMDKGTVSKIYLSSFYALKGYVQAHCSSLHINRCRYARLPGSPLYSMHISTRTPFEFAWSTVKVQCLRLAH